MTTENTAIMRTLEEIFLDTFSEDEYQFSLETTSDDISEWDSLSHIRLLTTIESEYGFQFDIEEIELLSSVSSIVDLISAKLA